MESRLADYLVTGYSYYTVQDLLCDLKVYQVADYDKISSKAFQIFDDINDDIRMRNSERNFIVKVLDAVLWALTLGYVRFLESEINTDPLIKTADKVRQYVVDTPLNEQTQRQDYGVLLEKQKIIDAQKKAEEAARKIEAEKLKAEQKIKEAEKKAAFEKLLEEQKKKAAEQKAAFEKMQAEALQKKKEQEEQMQKMLKAQQEQQAAAKKAQEEYQKKIADKQAALLKKEAEERIARRELNGKVLTEEHHKIKDVKEGWLDDIQAELARLNAKGMIPQEGVKAIVSSSHSKIIQDQTKVIIGRTREIKALYQDTHYVFTHAQSSGLSVINECCKELLKVFHPDWYNPLSVPFRSIYSVDVTDNVDAFVKKYPHIYDYTFNDDNLNKNTAELLSVDTYMWNTGCQESALYFLTHNSNIINDDSASKIFTNIFASYCHVQLVNTHLTKKAVQIVKDKKKGTEVGTLYTICVPKEVVKDPTLNFAYRSHAFGRKCRCYPATKDIEILEKTQKDEIVTCNGSHPQYRLLTGRLDQEKTVRAFPLNGLSKEKNKEFNMRVKNLMREFAFYAGIMNLSTWSTDEEKADLLKELNALSTLQLVDADCLNEVACLNADHIPPELNSKLQEVIAGILPVDGYDNFVK